jgi:hypothetical protein
MDLATRHEINMRREKARQIENHLNAHATEMNDHSVRFWTAVAKYERALAGVLSKLAPPGADPSIQSGPGRPRKDAA